MIIVFGSIAMDLIMRTNEFPPGNGVSDASGYEISPGGRGANQALSAARSGAKVSLIGKSGDDNFAAHILAKLKKEGISTSGVAKSKTPTGTNVHIIDKGGERRIIASASANAEASADQVPEEILNERTTLLLQTDMPADENIALLEKAKTAGATTVMNLSPSIELSKKALEHLDYLIVNHREAELLAEKMGLDTDQNAHKIAQGLSKLGNLNSIITVGSRGSVAVTKEGAGYTIGAMQLEELVDHSGAEDSYCGTLAACVQAGMPLPRAMKRASIAASLVCAKKGIQSAFPYLADIEEKLGDIDDPQKIDLF